MNDGDEGSVFDLLGISKAELTEDLSAADADAMLAHALDPATPEAADELVPTMADEPVDYGDESDGFPALLDDDAGGEDLGDAVDFDLDPGDPSADQLDDPQDDAADDEIDLGGF